MILERLEKGLVMHPAILGIAVGSQLTMLVADQVPKLNVEATCKGSVAADKAMGLMLPQGFDKCMSDENSAQQQLVPIWSSYSAAIRAQCEGEATAAGSASYLKFEASGLWRGTRTPSLKRRRILGSRSTIMVSCCQVAIRMPANGRSGSFATAQPCWVGLRSPLRDDHGASPHHEYPSLPSALPTASTANPLQAALTRPHAINISLVAWGRVSEKAINGGAKTLEADSHQPRSPLLVGPAGAPIQANSRASRSADRWRSSASSRS
jgi:hypothetical protein